MIEPQLLDRRIKMRGGNMRAKPVECCQLMLEYGKNLRHAGVARRRRREVFH